MEFLKRFLAPLTAKQWEEIDKRAKEIFSTQLYGRRVIDVEGPYGWEYSAYPLGEVEVLSGENTVKWGLRKSLPLIETRATFTLSLWELDNLERGKLNVDLSNLEETVRKVAEFEDEVIFRGCERAGIKGMLAFKEERRINVGETPDDLIEALLKSLSIFSKEGIEGPYALIINTERWIKLLRGTTGHYPLEKRVEDTLRGGRIITTPRIEEAIVISERGGDFKLILGQDLSIGYEGRESDKVRLFITETFTFQVVNPEAMIHLSFQV
ncbi:family 1 encapsulin nanocompartment shell protein [Thermotoga sp. KOL6]|uniref:family 1 encapsulin nanocompartment shell protein n=1 Tax=Thermotoga sp. KOL6 TaxID=126741 RepID=UPI000CAA48B5|nr:family 1 encapsulin nanocompartment shell protein [Thermotoga sp. KOL6]PLV59480.1 Maritimacin [Thermotoga sp. KOL6]